MMIQTPLKSKILSLEEFLKQPEIKPASEYIDGQIIQKPMPQGKHSSLQAELVTYINAALKSQKIARAFPELRCTFGKNSIVPDVTVFLWQRIPRDENGEIANTFSLAPDWTIEIISPGQSYTKVTKNILYCLKSGTQIGWLINPDEKAVFVYRPQQETAIFDEPDLLLPVPLFASKLQLKVQDLFAWLL
jgi:Uma2 family endonuclease